MLSGFRSLFENGRGDWGRLTPKTKGLYEDTGPDIEEYDRHFWYLEDCIHYENYRLRMCPKHSVRHFGTLWKPTKHVKASNKLLKTIIRCTNLVQKNEDIRGPDDRVLDSWDQMAAPVTWPPTRATAWKIACDAVQVIVDSVRLFWMVLGTSRMLPLFSENDFTALVVSKINCCNSLQLLLII